MALAQVYQFPREEATPKVAATRRPSFQFYPGDWRRDPALQTCSLGARGLWMEMLCIAHESTQYGVLSINGAPMTAEQLARIVGESPTFVKKFLKELEAAGVFSRMASGAIYSRRMLKDEELRNVRASHGHKGAKHGHKGKSAGVLGAEHGKKGGRPRSVTPPHTGANNPPLNEDETRPPSSSSSSSSSSSINSVTDVTDGEPSSAPRITDPKEIIFGYGVSMLTNAGTSDKQARTFLGGLVKTHGEAELINKLRECAKAKPLQPLTWLAAAMPPPKQATNKQEALERRNQAVGEEWEAEMRAQMQTVEG